jgi:hypothetical protein
VVTVAPMAKKDAVSKRLAEEIALAKRFKETKDLPPSSLLDLATPDEKEELAASLRLNEKDDPIRKAFKVFGLDHRSIDDGHNLLFHLARVLFPRRRPGPRKKWTAPRLCQLLADVAAYKRKHSKASDTAICNWLHRKSYPRESSDALRDALQNARNPKHNGGLASMAELVAISATGNWPIDEAATAKAVSWVIENADKVLGLRK